MIAKYSYIFIFTLLTFYTACGQTSSTNVGRESRPENIDLRIENLNKQATEMFESVKKNDFEKLANLTHPKIIERADGRENFILAMREAFQTSAENFESVSWSLGEPSKLVEIDGQIFSIIPRKLDGITPKKNKIVQEGSLVGISNDNGKNWRFVNGEHFNDLFPSATDKVKVPKEKSFINGIEQ